MSERVSRAGGHDLFDPVRFCHLDQRVHKKTWSLFEPCTDFDRWKTVLTGVLVYLFFIPELID